MFAGIASYLTRTNVVKENSLRKKQFLSWNKIQRIALIIDEKKSVGKNEIDKFIEATAKYAEVFFVELSSKEASFADWKCFTRKDRNHLDLPKQHAYDSIKTKKFDLVINISSSHPLFCANIVSAIQADFKCGNEDQFGELDLIIERKGSQNLIAYLNEVKKYLEMIKTN